MTKTDKSHCALILPGAVAKGAFEAGVIQELAEQETRIDRIVATSSGALNGVAYAAGIRTGREKELAAQLVDAWVEMGGWDTALNFNPWHFVRGRGLSDPKGLLKMLHHIVKPAAHSAERDVEMRIIVSPLNGVAGHIGKRPATTYEKVLHFSGRDFDTAEGLARIFKATTAACAFPGLFAPVDLEGIGPCIDGGAVNNAPIKYALDECGVNRIIMPVPFPEFMKREGFKGGMSMLNHMIEILINERLFRDLKNAQVINEDVTKLEALQREGTLTQDQLQTLQRVLEIRRVQIDEVRPSKPLPGNPFSGFFSRKERLQFVAEGRKAARESLKFRKQSAMAPLRKVAKQAEVNQ